MGIKFCEKSGAWLDGYVMEWLENGKQAVKENWDFIGLVDGVEGSGKSSLAITSATRLQSVLAESREPTRMHLIHQAFARFFQTVKTKESPGTSYYRVRTAIMFRGLFWWRTQKI